MIGFTLSKLNLLLLVTATFAIVAFFMFTLTDLLISVSAQKMVDSFSAKAAGIITSDSLCYKTEITVPPHISYFGGAEGGYRLFYKLVISRFPEEYDPEQLTSVIFAVVDRKNSKDYKVRAASRIDVNAEVIFYDWNPKELDVIDEKAALIEIDPQSVRPYKDSFILVKEVLAGKNYLHVIACSSDKMCDANLEEVACCKVPKARQGNPSFCLDCGRKGQLPQCNT